MMKLKSGWRAMFLAMIGLAAGCGRGGSTADNQPANGGATNDQNAQAAAAQAYPADGRGGFVAASEKKLKDLDMKMADFGTKTTALAGDAKTEADRAFAELRTQRNLAAGKLEELKVAGQDGWDKAKTGFADAWSNVETAYTNVKAKLN